LPDGARKREKIGDRGVLFSVIITMVSSTSSPSDLQLFPEQLLMVEAPQEEDEQRNSRHQHVSPAKKARFLREESNRRPQHEPLVVERGAR
jgi:hypothetical protein